MIKQGKAKSGHGDYSLVRLGGGPSVGVVNGKAVSGRRVVEAGGVVRELGCGWCQRR